MKSNTNTKKYSTPELTIKCSSAFTQHYHIPTTVLFIIFIGAVYATVAYHIPRYAVTESAFEFID